MEKNKLQFALNELLDNFRLMRMDDDLEILGKRLGFAEKKKEDLQGTKKWWKLRKAIKDERHGTDPLTERGEAKKSDFEYLEHRMKSECEEIFYEDTDAVAKKCKKLLAGEHTKLDALLILFYVKFIQDVYSCDLKIEKNGEDFDKIIIALLGDKKEGDDFLSTIRISFGKMTSLPKISKESASVALAALLDILNCDASVEESLFYKNAFAINNAEIAWPYGDPETCGTYFALIIALTIFTKGHPYNDVYRRAFMKNYLDAMGQNAKEALLEKENLPSNKKIRKIMHKFEELILD